MNYTYETDYYDEADKNYSDYVSFIDSVKNPDVWEDYCNKMYFNFKLKSL